jgi:hypothetical protein
MLYPAWSDFRYVPARDAERFIKCSQSLAYQGKAAFFIY